MLTRLALRDFRCFTATAIHPGPGMNFFIGANAQGKTSLLEAVCLLLRLQSPRARTLQEMIRHQSDTFALHGTLGDQTTLAFTLGNRRKSLLLNDAPPLATRDYLAKGRIVWFGNHDLDLVIGGGEQRRRYLDFAGQQCDPAYRQHLHRYKQALAARNRLLKTGTPSALEQCRDYDPLLVRHGEYLRTTRHALAGRLAAFALEAHAAIGGHQGGLLALAYQITHPALPEALDAHWERDQRLGQTTTGPHRDDLAITLDGHPAARFASEGQQRTIALALKCAQQRLLSTTFGPPPLLLIDDIFGELDLDRRRALLHYLPADLQMWITATHLDWVETFPANSTFHAVADASVTPTRTGTSAE